MKKILALLYICIGFALGTARGQHLNAPDTVCTSTDPANPRYASVGIANYNGNRTTWTVEKPAGTLAVQGVDFKILYGDYNTSSTGGTATAATDNRLMTIEFFKPGTYTVRAVVKNGGSTTSNTTKKIVAVDCAMTICKGQNTTMAGFTEDFGQTTTRIPLDPARGSIEYTYQATGGLNDNYYAIVNELQQRTEWDSSPDHTANGNGAMLVANSAYEPMIFYSRRVNGLCTGAVYNFSAWFRNADGKNVMENACAGGMIYAGVTFRILNAANGQVLDSFNTYDVSAPLQANPVNRGWQQYGGSFKTPPGVSNVIVQIRNNNPGGCGNDIAIDDISFSYCAPYIYSFFDGQTDQLGGEYTMCAGAETKLTSVYAPSDYFTDPQYYWQYSDDNNTWTTISGDGDGLTGSDSSVLVFAEDALLLQGDPNVITERWFRLNIYEGGNTTSCAQPSVPIKVILLPNPKISVAGAQICIGSSATLTACCGYDTYTWDDPAATESDNLTVSPTETTIYTVKGRKDYGSGRTCYRTAEAPVIVDDMPVPNLNMSTPATICLGQAVDMSIDPINAGYDILWQPNGETTTSIHDVPTTPGSKAYEVTITNGTCTVTDSRTVTVQDLPDVTIGSIPASCNTSGKFSIPYTGAVNSPDHYDVVAAGANPMPGFVAVNNQAMPSSSPIQVNYPVGTAPGTYTFNLVLRNTTLTCDRTKPFTVTIQAPSTAPTGILADKTQLCVSGTVTLTVQGGSLGTGAVWRWYAGACGGALLGTGTTITTPVITSTTTFYVRAESTGACGNTTCASATVTVLAQPVTANAGPDQQHCENPSFLMAGNAVTPSTAQGTWTVVSASVPVANIAIANIHDNNTTVTVPNGATATLAWTISNGVCPPTNDQVVLTNYSKPTVANAGADKKLCNVTSFTMTANTPTVGTGTWTRVFGTSGTATAPNSPTTTITGIAPGDSVVFRWTIANGTCTPSTDDVILVSYKTPTTANAGSDQKLCNVTSFTLAANTPAAGAGTGSWSTVYGGRTVNNITDPHSTITVIPGDSIILRWTIANGTCPPSTDDVVLVSYKTPTTANAGADKKLCNVTSFTMTANTPAAGAGTGTWTRVFGTSGTATNPTSPTTTITGITPGDSVVFRWTIANGTCTPSTDDVILVSYKTPTTANAGADQKSCNVTSFTLAANTPAAGAGTGSWSVVYGSRTPASLTNPNTTVTVAPGDSIILRWTIANGTCTPSTDDVVLVSYQTPSTAAAGPDQKRCNVTSFTMAATVPTVGKGTWTRVFGTTGTATNPTSPTTTITGITPGDSVIFRWTVANGTCPPSTDDVTLVSYQQPTTANAGADQKQCNVTSFTLAANTPTVGTGSWSVVYGSRTPASLTSPNTTVTVAPGDSIILRWTIANGTCTPSTDDVTLVSYQQPTTAAAGPDQKLCNVTSFTLAANTPTIGTGKWSVVYGSRTPANLTSATSTITVAPGDSIILRWTISNGTCPPSTDDVTLVSYKTPTTANAGADQKLCNVTSFTMSANTPAVGTGTWTRVFGTTGTATNPTSPTTTITGITPGDSVIFRWTIANGTCTPSTDDVTLVSYQQPTTANAGADQKQCNVTSFTLAANMPAVGTGSWSVVYGSRTPASLTSANTTVTVAPGDSIILRWTVANGTCTPSTDNVTLVSYQQPTTANAGADQKLCYTTNFTLAANTPTVGTGKWSIVYGTPNINNVNSPTSTVSLNAGDSVILRWTVTNGNCAASTDDVTLVSYESATIAAAGADQKLCNVSSFTLAANTPTIGTGMWSVVYGNPASVVTPTSPTSLVNVTPGDSLVLRWTISNGTTCPSNSDDVVLVSYQQPTTAAAGPDQKLCNVTSFTLAANTPTVGTGKWSVVYGSRTPANLTNATSTITVAPGDSIILRWTITNGTCTPSTDDVTLVSYKAAAPAAAGPDQKMCNVSSFTLAANAPGVPTAAGTWSVEYGTATVNAPNSPTSTVTVAPGDSVVLRWTITNGTCPPSTDDVVLVSYQQPTTAAAGPDQKMCNVTSFTLAANIPVVGTGRWSVIYGAATFNDATSPTAVATVAPGDSVVLRWTITNGTCPPSTDDVILVNYQTPATANAGPDQEQCSNTTGFTMAANAPGVAGAVGTWSISSGTANITDIHSPTTRVTVPAGSVATLRWTITNGPCAMTFDEVVIANRNPVMGNTISADQTVCLTENPAALTGAALTGGNGTYTYQWQSSTTSATAGFANIPGATAANYTPGLLSQDTWFRRVVTSGPCASVTSNAVKITVVNKPPVVIFVPGALTVDCKLGMDYTTLFGTPQFSHTPYNNIPLTITFTDATAVNGCTQTFTRTWTATDRCGMSTTASQTITVVDKTAPVFTSAKPADVTVSCDAIPAAVNLTATDDCFGNMTITPVETRQDIPGACANNYKLIRTWTATDGCNNTTTLTQTITVQDKTPPVFTSTQPRDTIVNCNAVPPAMPLTAVDNCTPGVITVTATDVRKNIPGATCTDNYQIVRTWIATDECGNTATLVQNITVQDTTRPVFSIPQPANVSVDCDKVPAWPAVTATDNCTANVQVITSEQKFTTAGACANNYRLVRTWKATDNCGNTAMMTQTITVQDTTRPVFTVRPPGDTMVNCNAVPPPTNNVVATDNCGTVKLGRTQVRETIPGACASNYRLIRTWTATDECGNTAVWRQVITVQDTTRPVIAAPPADVVLNCGDAIPVAPTLTATDNCDPAFPKQVTMVEDPYVKDLCAGYTITRRWRVADACGNQATEVVQRIVVNACPQPQLDPVLPVNCSDNPTFTIKTLNDVKNPTYTLVGIVPANAVQVPLTQQSNMFNLNNATQASFIVRDGVTGCVSDTMVYDLQYNTTPMVNLGRDTTICGGNSLILDAGASNFAYSIRWSTGETTQRINVSTAGTYWVSVTNGTCTATDTIRVTVIPMPLVDIPDASICRGQSVKLDAFVDGGTYLWSTGATSSSILVSTQEQFWVQVVKSGCITIDTVNVTVNPPPDITLNRDTTICPDQSVMLTVNLNNGGNVRWVTGATTNSIVVNEPGQYWVTVSRDNCMVKDTVNVRLQPSINVELGPNQEICPGSQITIDGTTQDAISYLWNDGDPNPVKNIWETGRYRLAVMDRFCNRVFYDSVSVRVASLPRIELGADTVMCIGETLRLRADGDNIKSVLWNDGTTGPFLDVTRAGTYSVTVFNDCGSSTDQITVDFTQCDPKPTFPNAFSPNGDGRNDYFRPVVRGPMYEYELRIFNRWGELIYLGYDSKKGWDGRYQGQPVTIGTYVWWLTYKKMPNGNPNVIKGEVTVIR